MSQHTQPGQDVPDELVKPLAEMLLDDYGQEFNAQHLSWQDFAGQARKILAVVLPLLPDFDWIPPDEYEENPEPDTCRPVEVDGETILLRGETELSEEGREAFGQVVRAAKARMDAEKAAYRQQIEREVRAKVAEEMISIASEMESMANNAITRHYGSRIRAALGQPVTCTCFACVPVNPRGPRRRRARPQATDRLIEGEDL